MTGRVGPLGACLLALAGCQGRAPAGSRPSSAPPARTTPSGLALTLGDIDADTPALKIERIEPLGRYLARKLAPAGVGAVRVRIAPSIERMIELLEAGEVDVYLDSLYPTLQVRRRSGSRIILRTWVGGSSEYHSLFVARKNSALQSAEDLRGRVVAFEEPHSTSGFFLPALHLRRAGHVVEELSRVDVERRQDTIAYVFSGDAENTVELVLRRRVDAGVISNEDYDAMPEARRDRLVVLERTPSLPRRLVSVRGDLAEALTGALRTALLGVAKREPIVLEDAPRAWSWKFEPLTPDVEATIEQLATFVAGPG